VAAVNILAGRLYAGDSQYATTSSCVGRAVHLTLKLLLLLFIIITINDIYIALSSQVATRASNTDHVWQYRTGISVFYKINTGINTG